MTKFLSMAYADPPYPGQANRYVERQEVDHRILIQHLEDVYSDGWALSTSSPALHEILSLCSRPVRIASWVKPFCAFKPGVNPAYSWEPVVFYGGRKGTRERRTVKDHFIHNITLKKGLVGAKPPEFCLWVLDLLGAEPGDQMHDMYPGTNIFSEMCREREVHSW